MHTHVLGLELLVVFEIPTHQSQTSQAFVGYLLSLYFSVGILQANLWILFELACRTLSFSSNFGSLPTCIDGTMLAGVTVPISVCGSRVTSHPDIFLSTTVTSDPPGFYSEVFPRTNTIVQLGEGSTNTYTCFWYPVTMVSPFTTAVCKVGIFTYSHVTTLPFT